MCYWYSIVTMYLLSSVIHSTSNRGLYSGVPLKSWLLKVIENRTIRKLGYGFLFSYSHSIATVGVFLAVSTQYTNVTDKQRDRHPA